MEYGVFSANEWLYPDITSYVSEKQDIRLHSARGSYAACQILLPHTVPGLPISVATTGTLPVPECFRLLDVNVLHNAGTELADLEKGIRPDASDYTRQAPFRVFDCLQPFEEGGAMTDANVTALYLSFPIPVDALPGSYAGSVCITVGEEQCTIQADLTVHKACVPSVGRMLMTNWIDTDLAARYGVEKFSEAWYAAYRRIVALAKRCRQSHMYIHLNSIGIQEPSPGVYVFDFTQIKRLIAETIAQGFIHLEFSHLTWKDYRLQSEYYIFYKPDGRAIPADSAEGYRFLAQFLPKWTAFLKEHGWYDMARQHIADEPMDHQVANFRTICCTVRKFMPGMRFFDAVSTTNLRGAVDCWVPLNEHYQLHREEYEEFRDLGDELWHYTCCYPLGKWLNRFLDMELLRPRLLYYGNYRYNLIGFLHWAFASWQPDQIDLREDTAPVINVDRLLPAGDTHICYPGTNCSAWMSMRAEATRMGVEDCELLWQIAETNQEKADALCHAVMRGFDDYTLDIDAFEENHRRILETADAL